MAMPKTDLVKTGVSGLDDLFSGGIPRGNIILLEGCIGAGKTTLGTEFVYRGAKEFGEPGVIVVFEVSPDKLARDAAGLGWDLQELERSQRLKIIYTTRDVFRQELRGGWGPRRLGLTSLPLLEPNALVLADWEQATVFWYLQLVEGINPGVEVRYPLAGLERAVHEASGRPVYLAAVRPGMKDALAGQAVSGVGSVVRVGPGAVASEATPALRRNLDYGHQIRLLGADFWDEQGRRQAKPQVRNGVIGVSLYWQALRTPEADYSVSVRLVAEDGRVVGQSDLTHPVLRLSPTSGWRAGEVRGDYHELPARGVAGRAHSLDVILYGREASGFRNLPVYDAGGRLVGESATLEVLERTEDGG